MRTAAPLLCLLHLHSWFSSKRSNGVLVGPKVKLAGTGRPQRSKVDWHRDTKWRKLSWVYCPGWIALLLGSEAYSHMQPSVT